MFPWILVKYNDIFTVEENKNKKKILTKSFMPNMIKSNLINRKISASFIKSNSSEIKKMNKNESDNKNGIEANVTNTNAIINENNEKNFYEQFDVEDKDSQIILDKDIRNFTIPMGMMSLSETGEKRKNNYISKYTMSKKEIELEEKKNKTNKKLYVYGSHYSNPLYVCHYLTRIFPFSNISIELQGIQIDY